MLGTTWQALLPLHVLKDSGLTHILHVFQVWYISFMMAMYMLDPGVTDDSEGDYFGNDNER
jgi:hypothetical protein